MKIWGLCFLGLLAGTTATAALDVRAAKEFLMGDWISYTGDHTWQFKADGQWLQFNGGVTTNAKFEIEPMPANLFRLTSSLGNSYIVHVAPTAAGFKLFRQDKEEVGLSMQRWAPTSPSSSASQPLEDE